MANATVRRPLPALVSLLALLLLTGIVWWRVASRDDSSDAADRCPSPSASSSAPAALPAPASITVQVLNSTKRVGLAGKVSTTLQHYGFRVTTPANDKAKTKNTATAQIRYGPAGRKAATLLRYYFPGAAMVTTTSKTGTVVIAVGSGYKAVATEQAVTAALKGDKLTVASSAPSPSPSTTAAGC